MILAFGQGLPYIGHMPTRPANIGRRRQKRTPPHVPIKALRLVANWTLDDLADAIGALQDPDVERPSRGTLSAIESGTRGASTELLTAIEQVFRLEPGMITTTYRPRLSPKNLGGES
jgi:hypothetical protein